MAASISTLHKDIYQASSSAASDFALSVIIPTRNEAGNIAKLLTGIDQSANNLPIEVIFVDDSTDETPQVVEAQASNYPDLHVRLIHRELEERVGGLGGAVLRGLKAAGAEYACVMDGDLQHPPEMIPVLYKTASEMQVDLVTATRRAEDSKVSGLNLARNQISRALDLAARIFFPRQLRGVTDPLTGFFLVRIKALNLEALRPNGFKILLEILIRNPKLRKAEVPFHFAERFAGQSKASATEAWRYFNLLWSLRFGTGFVRFAEFALVGVSGILVNSLVLYLATAQFKIYYLVSVAIATVASTLWNFGLNEAWVFRSRSRATERFRRLMMFLTMNIAALGLRSPLIFVMTTWFGIHYLASNLISLALMTVVRFVLADSIIWGQKASTSPTNVPKEKTWRPMMNTLFSYDIHNIVTVVSEAELPELKHFLTKREIEKPTIRVRMGIPRKQSPGEAETGSYLRYREIFGHIGFEVGIQMGEQVDVVATPTLVLSPHVLYTNVVEPILRWTFVKKGYSLVHGATIAFGQEAFMITARTDTGKTTTLLKILSHQRRTADQAAFLSDDMTIVSSSGVAMTYPKPLTISYHTLRAINSDTLSPKEKFFLPIQSRIHSRSGRKVASVISKTHLPAATINMVMQMIVPPPKYFVEKLVPKVKLSRVVRLAGMFIIERGEEQIRPIANQEALEILLKNCEDAYGFPPYDKLKGFLYHQDGIDLREKEQAIIREAIGGLPATQINSSNLEWWCQIPPFVSEEVAKDCTCETDRAQEVLVEINSARMR
jgi:dolichol-phosphate mannosyltransferase